VGKKSDFPIFKHTGELTQPARQAYLMKILVVLILLVVDKFTFPLFAQYNEIILPLEQISIEKGLPDRRVNCIIQDHLGFMWFGTNNGLCRYDGYKMMVYQNRADDSTSISNNKIECLFLDSQGSLWVGTDLGLNKFNFADETFRHFHRKHGLSGDTITDIIEDKFGKLYIATRNGGLNIFNPATEKFVQLVRPFIVHSAKEKKEPIAIITKMLIDSRNNLWVTTGGAGLVKIQLPSLKFTNYLYMEPSRTPVGKPAVLNLHQLTLNRNNEIFIGSVRGILKFNPQRQVFENYPLTLPSILENKEFLFNIENLLSDSYGNIWFTINPYTIPFNLAKIDWITNRCMFYNTDPLNLSNTELQRILSIYEDRSGLIWLGTMSDGVFKYSPVQNINSLYHDENNSNSLTDNRITAIKEDSYGYIWIGTMVGLNRADLHRHEIKRYYPNPEQPNSLPSKQVNIIYEDHQRNLWIGTNDGLCLYQRSTDDFKTYLPSNRNKVLAEKGTDFIRTIYQDCRGGTLWIGTGNGLYEFSPHTATFVYHPHPMANPVKQRDKVISCLYEDRQGTFWVGTWGAGLAQYDRSQHTFKIYSSEPIERTISNDKISAIFEDSDGRLWIGTDGGGINYYDRSRDTFLLFDQNSLIISNRIIGICEDQNRNLWIATYAGITRLNLDSHSIKNYTKSDGMTYYQGKYDYQITWDKGRLAREKIIVRPQLRILNNFTQTKNGWLFVGGVNGVNYFHPDSLFKKNEYSPIYITSVEVPNYRKYILAELLQNNHLTLKYDQNNLIIEYTLLDYTKHERILYSHFLVGRDKSWSPRHVGNTTIYSSLPPGQYVFRVNGTNPEGSGTLSETRLYLTITPPYWQTWWFRIFIILLGTSLIVGTFLLRTRAIRKQKEQLEIEVTKRTVELQEKSAALAAAHATLEQKVEERTHQLAQINKDLEREIQFRKATEEALRASEETTRVLLNAPHDLAFLITPDGVILALNKAAANRFGYPAEELIGKRVDTFIPTEVAKIRFEKLTQCLSTKEMVRWEDTSRGTVFDNYFYPILDNKGNVSTVAVYARDITDQKAIEKFLRDARATLEEEVKRRTRELDETNKQLRREIHYRQVTESRLRASEQKFRDLFQNSNDPIWTTDAEGKFLTINKCLIETSGYSKKELLNLNPLSLIPPSHRFKVILNYKRVMKNKAVTFECDFLTKDGNIKNMWVKVRPILKNDQVIGIHGIGRDITQLKAALQELQVSEQTKRQNLRQFTLQLAHEIKNPLASIKSSAQLVADSTLAATDPKLAKHMEVISRNVDICNQVIQELYAYTQPQRLNLVPVPATNFCQKLHDSIADRIESHKHIKFLFSYPAHLPTIQIDEIRLIHAFQNIIYNAIEAIPAEGQIKFTAKFNKKNRSIDFTIADTGIGISPEVSQNIFQPFYTTKAKGFGIGLTAAKEVVEAHKGNISITSKMGKGTTFTITLPVIQLET